MCAFVYGYTVVCECECVDCVCVHRVCVWMCMRDCLCLEFSLSMMAFCNLMISYTFSLVHSFVSF